MEDKKCVILFSGGLDSRLAVKIMQERDYEIHLFYLKLPFGGAHEKEAQDFSESQNLEINILDCTKGNLFREYFEVIKEAKHGRGSGVNPCIDCKIFMFRKAKLFADSKGIKHIVSGEVVGQRPMSQKQKQISLIEKEAGLKGRIIRPLIEEGIEGRQRKKQMNLAEKFKIDYPSPAGGCLLCEKYLKCRFEYLMKRGLNEKELPLINVGRHFLIDGSWIILGRDEKENKILESTDAGKLIIPDFIGPSALIIDLKSEEILDKVNNLLKAYSKEGSLDERGKFNEFKI